MADNGGESVLSWLPEQSHEDALHANRLLPVEERPFQRVSKSLLSKSSLVRPIPNHLPSPPPEGEEEAARVLEYQVADASQLRRFREDVLLDFAALESSITRIQLIHSSNERERERYASEKAKILETAQAVRDNTAELRIQLTEAQRVLELRKGYDALAIKILDDKKLRSRDESRAEIEKLEKEIEDLEQENAEFEGTWVTRKEYFDRVVAEGEAMMRHIRGIKDEAEADAEADKDDNMEDGEDADDEAKIENSRTGTPAPDGRSPRPTDTRDLTPMPETGEAGDATPARPTNKLLELEDNARSSSHMGSPLSQAVDMQDDIEMGGGATPSSLANPTDPDRDHADGDGDDDKDVIATAVPSLPAHTESMDET